jgi:hypothetical protein
VVTVVPRLLGLNVWNYVEHARSTPSLYLSLSAHFYIVQPLNLLQQRAIFSGLSRKLETGIADKFGVRVVYDTIPLKYRPERTELGYSLLVKLSQLAARVPDLASFRKRLSSACERRAENNPEYVTPGYKVPAGDALRGSISQGFSSMLCSPLLYPF